AKAPVPATAFLLCALPALLLWKNAGTIHVTNGPLVRELTGEFREDLPAGQSVVLSEDPIRLLLLRAGLGARSRDSDALLLDTTLLMAPRYHVFMARRFPSRWPVAPPTNEVETVKSGQWVELISAFAAREPVFYLHPSSGLFFESFM